MLTQAGGLGVSEGRSYEGAFDFASNLTAPKRLMVSLYAAPKNRHVLYLAPRILVASHESGKPMDLIYIGLFIAFFAASAGLIHFCGSLMNKERS